MVPVFSTFLIALWVYAFTSSQLASTKSQENIRKRNRLDPSPAHDPLKRLLSHAGYFVEQDASLQEKLALLPSWNYILEEYGDTPRIVGLETCEQFRNSPDPAEHMISVAGTFNSGTNLLATLLWKNCYMVERVKKYGRINRGVRWQVPYGKHSPVDNETYRQLHRAENERGIDTNNVLPVVTIRDPYFWMTAMCRHQYHMRWPKSNNRCPNLVPVETDSELLRSVSSIPVQVKYNNDTVRRHLSMAHHFNDFYGAYLNASWPRVIVRYEDLIFRPRAVIEKVCACAGGKLLGFGLETGTAETVDESEKSFNYVKESAKDKSPIHGKNKTGLIEAMIQYKNGRRRDMGNMTTQDLAFAEKNLDPRLLSLFHYKIIPSHPNQ